MSMRQDQKLLLAAAILAAGVWFVPFLQILVLPLTLFNTHVHELGHALAALATGGQVQYIAVHLNGSGETPVSGGNILFVASAGYVGSAIAGGLVILGSRKEEMARRTLWAVFGLLAMSLALFVRADWVGWASGLFWLAAIGLGAKFLKKDALVFFARFLGMSLCLSAFQALMVLLNISTFESTHSDATILHQATGIPAMAWAVLWLSISGFAVVASLKSAWKRPKPEPLLTQPSHR